MYDWSVKEAGAPILEVESLSAPADGSLKSYEKATRAVLAISVPTPVAATHGALTLNFAGGDTLVIPQGSVRAVFAPGSLLPFGLLSWKFVGDASDFVLVGLF